MNPQPRNVVRYAYLVASVAGVLFFAMSVALLGIWPSRVLQKQIDTMSPDHPLGLSASEQRGRRIYGREGCAYCHTQQVRYVDADMARFGAPTLAWETRFDYPHLWGTRRIGPDLAREAGSHPTDWHMQHLLAPRSIVADSVMPAYPWLFDGASDRPTQDARDLVAYLETLGRARELAGPEGEAKAHKACNCDNDEMTMMAFHAKQLNANPARARRTGDAPSLPTAQPNMELYRQSCASCHGAKGEGDGPGAKALRPPPANLAGHRYASARLSFTLANGVDGSAMPAWRDLAINDRAAIAAAVLSLHQPQAEPSIPPATLDLGAKVYQENCAQCHGTDGAGDGSSVPELRPLPANFQQAQPSLAVSLGALRNGVEGTRMAPWTGRLSEAELSAVAYYVRTLFKP